MPTYTLPKPIASLTDAATRVAYFKQVSMVFDHLDALGCILTGLRVQGGTVRIDVDVAIPQEQLEHLGLV